MTNRRLGMVVGVLVMGAIAFSLRQDGLLPDDWTPRPRVHDAGDAGDAAEPVPEDNSGPLEVQAPTRRSHRANLGRLLGPAPVAEAHRSESARGQLRGRVEDQLTHAPIPNAQLAFRHAARVFTTITDDEGQFHFEAPNEGAYALALAEAAGYFSYVPAFGADTVFFASPGWDVEAAVIQLEAEAAVRVVVHAPSGEVTPAQVRVLGAAHGSLAPATESYDAANGEVVVRAQQDSVLEAVVSGPGQSRAIGYSRLNAAASVTGVLHIRTQATTSRNGPLEGQVLSLLGSAPIEGAQVNMATETPEGDTLVARVTTDDGGHFSYDGEAPGPFTVWVHAPGFAAESRRRATRDSPVVLLLNEEANVEGRVLDEDGRPIPSFSVFAEAHIGVLERHLRAQSSTFNARGEFRLGGLSSGGYTISVVAEGYAPQTHEVHLARGDSVRTPDFRLRRGAALRGRVLSASGGAIAGAYVRVESAMDGTGLPLSTDHQTDSEGAFVVSGLSEGRVVVTIVAAGHHARVISAQAGGPDVQVTLNEVAEGEETQLELPGTGAGLHTP